MKRVLVGMSGGIDSSVAAYLMKKEGHEVIGVTMLTWPKDSPYPYDGSSNSCYSPNVEKNALEAERICRIIGIEHMTVDCSKLFESEVVGNFRKEYLAGRTPSPCIWCNRKIKFGSMLEEARKAIDFDFFATGHYARIERNGERTVLKKAVDEKKDQSYFLSMLTQTQLSSVVFPLGEMTKDETRRIDRAMGFHEAGQGESQDFYKGDYSIVIGREDKKGDIVLLPEGRKIGSHLGYWRYTVGQRRGTGVSFSEPLYVVDTDPVLNVVYVGRESLLMKREARCSFVNWVSREGFEEGKPYFVKLRSASKGEMAYLKETDEGFSAAFKSPQRAVAPGQFLVAYDGDEVVAAGVLEKD